MTFKVRKRLEIDRAAPVIVREKACVKRINQRISRLSTERATYRLDLAPFLREMKGFDHISDRRWDWLKVAGGSGWIADHLEAEVRTAKRQLQHTVNNYASNITSLTDDITRQQIELQQVKFRLRRAESMPNAIVTLDTDKLDSDLSVCDDYVNGSIKLKIHEEWLGEDTYRITYQTPQLIARCARGSNEDIVISPINVDITMGGRNHGVKFRSVNGLSKRYGGYNGSEVLHPHMTSTSQPCLGDFSGPVQDASEDYDIVTLVTLVGMFLRQFDPEDPAGRRFYHWPESKPEPVSYIDSYPQRPDSYPQRPDSVNTQLIDEMLDDIFADEDRCESDYADEYVRSN